MKTLILPVKRKWFDLIKIGEKSEEYRLFNDYWQSRLLKKTYDKVVVTLGYPKKSDKSRRLEFKWAGYRITKLKHEEWGGVPQKVFAIKLMHRI